MDKKKPNKEEKIGSDGLTKKERRALKVQAKQTDDNKAELKINQKNKETAAEVKVEENIQPAGEVLSNCSEKKDNMSEKQKRKLEWEKKQAEQAKLTDKTDSKEVLSKAELKARRREIQEAQRLAKMKQETEKNKNNVKTTDTKISDTKIEEKAISKPCSAPKVEECKNVNFFNHLLASNSFKPIEEVYPPVVPDVHPAFIKFGILYCTGSLPGSNEKTVKFLSAIESLVLTVKVPPGQEFCRYIETALDRSVDFLQQRKHVTFFMMNAFKAFKTFLMQLDKNLPDEEKKEKLTDFIDTFIQDQIIKAGMAISLKIKEKIFNNDEILVFGWSHTIFNILVDTFKEQKKDFSVIIVDSRPSFGGEEMLKKIAAVGIKHQYVMIHALSHVMPSVTTVLLEADALMTNGYLVSKAGTAQIARMAQFYSKPVLVCCETYKFTEKEQTDGMVCNELGKLSCDLEELRLNIF
ncbi:translation initiation factor eIF-2B subunit delta isoform X2 [Coccinella septempunctata]|uniref:translation initiation factor eIF-2B subunit delta isoform X2 n=1 Tax=Coccinella septempunctata TaxID=41139 RepID=UPI001D07C2A2|nr:translation initiation factor eIF-2B subunit delta isoform X2 [Coccinella septempunctata]